MFAPSQPTGPTLQQSAQLMWLLLDERRSAFQLAKTCHMVHQEMGIRGVVDMIAKAWAVFGMQGIPTMVLAGRMKMKMVNGGTSTVVIPVCVERVVSAYD